MIAQRRRSRSSLAPLWAFALALFDSLPCVADEAEPAPVYLKIDPCVPVQEVIVRQVLAVDFGTLYTQVDAPSADVTYVLVDCSDTQTWLRVTEPQSGKSLRRRFDLWTVDTGVRERLLAVAIAELVSVSRTELLADPKPVESAPTSPAIEPPAVALRPVSRGSSIGKPPGEPRRLRVLGVAAATGFFSGNALLWGGGLRLGAEHRRHLGWSADLIAQHADVTTAWGQVSLDAVGSSGALLYELRGSHLTLHLGGGLRGGLAYLRGAPQSLDLVKGGSLLAPWGGPLATASISLRLLKRLAIEAQLESGYALFSVIGHVIAAPAVGLSGVWLGAQIGIGLLP